MRMADRRSARDPLWPGASGGRLPSAAADRSIVRPGRVLAVATAFGMLLAQGLAAAQPGPKQPGPDPIYDEKGRAVPPPEQEQPGAGKVTLPKPLNYVEPRYPEEAKAAGIEGEVILKLDVDIDGNVTHAVVSKPGGHGFDEAALEAAARLKFSPARRPNGNPFAARIKYRYEFKLQTATPAPAVPGAPGSTGADEGGTHATAQPTVGALRGQLLIQGVDEPLVGATVLLAAPDGTERSALSDAKGEFVFLSLAPGSYRLRVQAAGYQRLEQPEEVVAVSETVVTYRLDAELVQGAIEVTVEGQRPAREVTRRTIEQREIARIPGTRGDALRAVENMPGVARPPGPAGILLVRGSGPQDTQVFIDGVYVPIIYHFGGLSSVVPTELLSKIDFYPGNFSSQYGRVMGGIVDAGIRSPRSDGYHGLAQLDMIDARLLAEGPVPLLEHWTFAAAGRRSWFDAWLGPALTAAGAGATQAPRYYDYQFILEHRPNEGSKVRTSFFGSDDGIQILIKSPVGSSTPVAWGDAGLSTRWWRLVSQYDFRFSDDDELHATLALGRDAIDIAFSQYFLQIENYSLLGRVEWGHQLSKAARFDLGIDWQTGMFDVAVRLPAPNKPGEPADQPFLSRTVEQSAERGLGLRPAAYVEFELTPDERTRIVPGVRFDYALDSKRFDVSPRLNARYQIVPEFPRTTVKGGIGLYHQPPQYQEVVEPFGTPGLTSNRAIHYGLGVEQDITEQFGVTAEGFFKQLDQLVRGEASATSGRIEYNNSGRGYVVGAEVLAKYKPDEHFFGWIAYTLSRSVRQDGPDAPEHLVSFDQTHILTALGSYRIGHGWEIGARFRLVSGNLVTPEVCNSASESCDPNRINALWSGATGAFSALAFGSRNSERLPLFHQLDLRVDKSWTFALWKLSAYIDIQNLYNQQNVEGINYNYNYTARQYTTGLPILPSFGMRGEF
jgi:TonB family protein